MMAVVELWMARILVVALYFVYAVWCNRDKHPITRGFAIRLQFTLFVIIYLILSFLYEFSTLFFN
jgi:hypothetical protein